MYGLQKIGLALAAFGLALTLIGGAGNGEKAHTAAETIRPAAARQETRQVQKRSSETERKGGGKREEANFTGWDDYRRTVRQGGNSSRDDAYSARARLTAVFTGMGKEPGESLLHWLGYRHDYGDRVNLNRSYPTGFFKVTAYTNGLEDTEKDPDDPGYGITATGTYTAAYRTVAADWEVLPPGSIIYIDGLGVFIVEDKGAAVRGQHIDRFVDTTGEAIAWGVRYRLVYIIKKGAG